MTDAPDQPNAASSLSIADPSSPCPEAVWRLSAEDFIGPCLVAPSFSINGREDEFDWIWEAPVESDAAWRSSDGAYSIHVLADEDWQPPLAILRHGHDAVGFYADGMAWIDPGHRGKGLSSELILVLVERLGRPAYDNTKPLGFTDRGYAAHRRAHAVALQRAVERGLLAHSLSP